MLTRFSTNRRWYIGEEPLETEQQQQEEEVLEAFGPLEEGAIYSLAGITQFLEVGDIDEGIQFKRDLQQWLALKEEEVKNMAAQLAEVEAHRQQQAQEFVAEIEQLKQRHLEEIENALAASTEAQEELKNAEAKSKGELERALAESENKHREEVEAIRAQLEKETEVEGGESSEREGSLIPRLSPQLSPVARKKFCIMQRVYCQTI